jgi:hypothetical protein
MDELPVSVGSRFSEIVLRLVVVLRSHPTSLAFFLNPTPDVSEQGLRSPEQVLPGQSVLKCATESLPV